MAGKPVAVAGRVAMAGQAGLDSPIGASGLPGASSLQRAGRRIGIATVRDLLTTFPRRYEDLRDVTPLGGLERLEDGSRVTVRATVVAVQAQRTFRRRL